MKLILITEEITKQFTIKRLWDTSYFLTFFAAATFFLAFVLAFFVTFFINFIPFPFWATCFDGFLATFLAPTDLLATFFAPSADLVPAAFFISFLAAAISACIILSFSWGEILKLPAPLCPAWAAGTS